MVTHDTPCCGHLEHCQLQLHQQTPIAVVTRSRSRSRSRSRAMLSRKPHASFLAPVPQTRITKVGNAAVQGAREVLLSAGKRDRIEALVKRIEHIELETTADFFELFVEGCQFKPMPATL